jgi:hypothetical protein
MKLRLAAILLSVASLSMTGCLQRTISITSQPSGALVYLNDEEVGRTPLTVPFTYYGTYDVRLEHADAQPLWTTHKAVAPLYDLPGPDLIAEAVPNGKVELEWHFEMQEKLPDDADLVIEHARQIRALVNQ